MIQMTQAQFDELKSKADAYFDELKSKADAYDKLTRDERTPIADERAAFEADYKRRQGTPIDLKLLRDGNVYHDGADGAHNLNVAWETWQARAALASAPVAGEYTTAMGDAGQAYIDSFPYAHKLPAQFRWADLWTAMSRAAPQASPAADGRDAVIRAARKIVSIPNESGFIVLTVHVEELRDRLADLDAAIAAQQGEWGTE